MEITEEKFRTFIKVRNSGKTNMWDSPMVVHLSDYVLTEEDVTNIIHDWNELEEVYGDHE